MAAEEARVGIERVLAVSRSYSHTQRAQSGLKVLACYIELYNAFLYACVKHAADACAQQLKDLMPHRLAAPRAAYIAAAVSNRCPPNLWQSAPAVPRAFTCGKGACSAAHKLHCYLYTGHRQPPLRC